ncbi:MULTISPECIES: hypothetical protein [Pseudomonas]|uniref:Uncharacterized protein n=1 Tax=Pseudomonas lutea TaxID=243924 RepID=A0A9X8QLS1_9PSED|nr:MULTISPECIES: hypothetical protein [Pseudomonas]SER37589.1 hypothetical protein SAMN05216409_118102 [Pseudomonas lutea]
MLVTAIFIVCAITAGYCAWINFKLPATVYSRIRALLLALASLTFLLSSPYAGLQYDRLKAQTDAETSAIRTRAEAARIATLMTAFGESYAVIEYLRTTQSQ